MADNPAIERRFLPEPAAGINIETRDGKPHIIGTAAVFYDGTLGSQYQLWEGCTERIMPGAFDRALAEHDDCRALFNHDPNLILGRTTAGTLTLTINAHGLNYDITPPKATYASDLQESIARRDVTGSSFGFQVIDQAWIEGDTGAVREIRAVKLYDVSPATYPAYSGTSAGVRTEFVRDAWASFEEWRKSVAAQKAAPPLVSPEPGALSGRLKRLAEVRARYHAYIGVDELNKAKRRL